MGGRLIHGIDLYTGKYGRPTPLLSRLVISFLNVIINVPDFNILLSGYIFALDETNFNLRPS